MIRREDTFFMSRGLTKYINNADTGDGVKALMIWSNILQSHANLTRKEIYVVNFDSTRTSFKPAP